MAEGERLTHVGFDESQEELVLITSTLVNLQDYVQHTIGIEVETSCQERTVGKMKKKKKKHYCRTDDEHVVNEAFQTR